jgi:hypothetical protein
MALVVKDRVKETTTTVGTGTLTLAGASAGFQSFAVIGNGNTTYYTITDGTDWEVGIGTYTSSGTTLSRDTILESSNSGNAVVWGAGTKDVFVTYPAERSVYTDGAGTVITPATASALGVASGGTGQTSYTNGELLIGNTSGNTLTKSTLTAGTGISITNGTGSITLNNTGAVYDALTSTTGYFDLPAGSTAQRPGSPQNGMIRYNSSNNFTEIYADSAWKGLAMITLPNAPTIGTATAGSGQASVAFTPSTNTGGNGVFTVSATYTATSSPGSITGTGSSSPITVTGLTNGTAYTFTVAGTNAYGTGPSSAASNSVTPLALDVQYLVIAGGGGGGGYAGGGGGAGGYRAGTLTSLAVNTNYTVTVGGGGGGGSGTVPSVRGTSGSNSVFSSITSAGGGGGGSSFVGSTTQFSGGDGGSGGGGGLNNSGSTTGGTGNTPNTSPSQGNNGGGTSIYAGGAAYGCSGGGGASATGGNGNGGGSTGASGGAGTASTITGPSVTRAGGGGGFGSVTGGTGVNGGGNGGNNAGANGTAGSANTGGGGGGAGQDPGNRNGLSGGSGLVVLRYSNGFTISNPGGGLTLSTTTSGSDKITTVTAGSGNVSWS